MKKVTFESVFDSLTAEQQETYTLNQFPYLFAKAQLYLEIGPDLYRKNDFFQQPPIDIDPTDLKAIKTGCEQILEGKGFELDSPFQDIGVSGFYRLMELFHFEFVSRKTKHGYMLHGFKGALDRITFSHALNNHQITLHNFCKP
jgi:hypothetical protein